MAAQGGPQFIVMIFILHFECWTKQQEYRLKRRFCALIFKSIWYVILNTVFTIVLLMKLGCSFHAKTKEKRCVGLNDVERPPIHVCKYSTFSKFDALDSMLRVLL